MSGEVSKLGRYRDGLRQGLEAGFVKVHVTFGEEEGTGGEYLWATPLGDGTYRVASIPFFVRCCGYEDVVRAEPGSDGLEWSETLETRSRTLFVAYKPRPEAYAEVVKALVEFGVKVEGMQLGFCVAAVPSGEDPPLDDETIRAILAKVGARLGEDFEDMDEIEAFQRLDS